VRARQVSCASFAWAHALVASRALDLLCAGADAPSARCMLPVVDLCNHAAEGDATVALRMGADAAALPRCVQLVAVAPLCAGTPLTFSYGERSLRRWAAAYAFLPAGGGVSEPFEELCADDDDADSAPAREVLLASAHAGGAGLLRLCELRVRAVAAASRARVCYIVRDASAAPVGAAVVTLDAAASAPPARIATLQPRHEAALCAALSARASAAVARMAAAESELEAAAADADADAGGVAGAAELSRALRGARCALLRRVADDLAVWAALLDGDAA
jgi:hypothetical protein